MEVVVTPAVPPSPPGNRHRPGSPSSPNQFKATDIALSLTVIEGERYAEISQTEYVVHLRGAISKHIESATKLNNRLVNWVKQNILGSVGSFLQNKKFWINFSCRRSEDVQKRATNFRHFVMVAEVIDCS